VCTYFRRLRMCGLIDGYLYSQAITNPTACMLGKWYYGEGQFFASSKAFQQLEEPHNELHLLGHQLIVESRKKSPSMEKLTDLSKQLTQKSLLMIEALHSLEHCERMKQQGSESRESRGQST
ncbi:MAG: CZB domain-containing protein, partial [Methyloprofundus sp.]|nr:CZB domain-containing protein [Methyloprofundus sp.]